MWGLRVKTTQTYEWDNLGRAWKLDEQSEQIG